MRRLSMGGPLRDANLLDWIGIERSAYAVEEAPLPRPAVGRRKRGREEFGTSRT